MIAPMEKLVVAGPRRLARELLAELQRAGVVHIDPLRPEELEAYALSEEEKAQLKEWERIAAGAEQAAKLLGLELEPQKPFTGSQAEVAQALEPVVQKASVLAGERERLLEELEFLRLYRGAVEALAELVDGLDRSRWLRVLPVLLEKEELVAGLEAALAEALPERYVLAAKPAGEVWAAAVVVLNGEADAARAALGRLGLSEFRLPGAYADLSLSEAKLKMAERARLAPGELESVEEAIRALVREAREKLMAIWTRAKDEIERLKRLESLARGRFSFGLFGWVPVSKKSRVEDALERLRERVVYAFEPVDEHHEADRVPVTLENPAWIRPFETLVTFLNVPKYGTWDPSWVLAAFFPFWFGMIVGDIGYAMLFWLLARFLGGYVRRGEPLVLDLFGMKLAPAALDNTVRILKPMVFWTVVFGILYGEFFGNFLEHLGVFYVPGHGEGLFRILIPRTLGAT
ncbi:MAG TPA: V-type ATP synthase subunit I, partial [Oceanithermus sp.]|nr:V-type ATP synthase subunit I [Oceanithermus sp.]